MGWLGKIGGALGRVVGVNNDAVDSARAARDQFNDINPLSQGWNNVGGSQLGGNAMRESLLGLQGMAKTGYSDADRARQAQILEQSTQDASRVRQGALQDLARRGSLNSGGAISEALLGSQDAINKAGDQANQLRVEGEARKLQVLNQLGVQGQSLDQQVFNQNLTNQQGRMGTEDENYQRLLELQKLRANALLGVGSAQEARNQNAAGLVGAGLGAAGKLFGR